MLISAGFITGTRTATVPQPQAKAAAIAPETRFFMVDFPKALERFEPVDR
jgi:hypothetical protein